MNRLDKLALIWGEAENTTPPGGAPGIGAGLWADVVGHPWIRQPSGRLPDLSGFDYALVNVFHTYDSGYVENIKDTYPHIKVLAAPDPSLDLVLAHPEWDGLFQQVRQADAVAGRTYADCAIYGTLFSKKSFWLPSPIGPDDFYLPLRDLPKQDYIVTLDHRFAPANTAFNVATLAALQRKTGWPIKYVAERDWTHRYASWAGLNVEWLGDVPSLEFPRLVAQARIGVDMYASHAVGRFQILCAMVGTICIASDWCDDAPGIHSDPTKPQSAAFDAIQHWESRTQRDLGFYYAQEYTIDSSRERLISILEQL